MQWPGRSIRETIKVYVACHIRIKYWSLEILFFLSVLVCSLLRTLVMTIMFDDNRMLQLNKYRSRLSSWNMKSANDSREWFSSDSHLQNFSYLCLISKFFLNQSPFSIHLAVPSAFHLLALKNVKFDSTCKSRTFIKQPSIEYTPYRYLLQSFPFWLFFLLLLLHFSVVNIFDVFQCGTLSWKVSVYT